MTGADHPAASILGNAGRTWVRRAGSGPALVLGALLAMLWLAPALARAAGPPFLSRVPKEVLPLATTVPANGAQNPYGIVTVPRSIGWLHRGDLLVSNFNNNAPSGGEQGTGTTIVEIPPAGSTASTAATFAKIDPHALPGGVGLTTALAVTRSGLVFVGDLPTSDGTSATAKAGGLLVLNSHGRLIETISGGPINGPWDMTATEHHDVTTLYITNVLNGTVANSPNVVKKGTVVRLRLRTRPGQRPQVLAEDVIARGFPERTDPSALVIGPTGVALAHDGTLYVADTLDNRIAAVPHAATRSHAIGGGGVTVSSDGALNGPLGLTLAPGGDILAANGGNGNIVETTPTGSQVATVTADDTSAPGGAGVLFGLTVSPFTHSLYFVDDGLNAVGEFAR